MLLNELYELYVEGFSPKSRSAGNSLNSNLPLKFSNISPGNFY